MDTLRQNLRYAFRTLTRSPGFSVLALLTLALGIGATTSIFTVLNAVVLNPLPYPESERLVRIENRVPGVDPERTWNLSPAGYFYFREQSRSVEDLGVYTTPNLNLTGDGPAERVQGAFITDGVLNVLRARPAHGRLITREDTRPATDEPGVVLPGPAEPVAVLGYDFWTNRYGADPSIVGRTIQVNGNSVPVVGVLAQGVDLPNPGANVDIWMPLGLNPSARPVNWHGFQSVARLRDGVTHAAAQQEFERLTSHFTELFPDAYSAGFMEETGFAPVVTTLREFVIGGVGRTLWILFGAVGLVLLIACANVANLFLVRTEGRRREIAVRAALGATRGDLGHQFMAESVVLAFLGGAAGLFLAHVGVQGLVLMAPEVLPRLGEIGIGWTVVAFSLGISLLVGLALGALPLLRFGTGISPAALREGGRGATEGRGRTGTRSLLVVGQVAMALILLASAGLLFQSFQRLRAVDPGVEATGVLTMQLTLPSARYGSEEDAAAFYQSLTARIEALPGVTTASTTTYLPLSGDPGCASVFIADRQPRPDEQAPCVPAHRVSPGYFQSLGIPVQGSTPDWNDVLRQAGTVVVSAALANRLWPGEDPMGKGIRPNGWGEPFYRVIGVASDVRAYGLHEPPAEAVYFPIMLIEGTRGWGPPNAVTLVVRTQLSRPEALTGTIRSTLAQLDPDVPLANVQTMESVIAESMARTSFAMVLLAIAAAVALLLGAVGLYGVISYVVGQRTQEIGIRMALGARMGQVAGSVVRQSLVLAASGVVVGVVGAVATTRVLQALLYDTSPTEPVTLAVVSLLLIAVALLASYLPARRATQVDPIVALRSD